MSRETRQAEIGSSSLFIGRVRFGYLGLGAILGLNERMAPATPVCLVIPGALHSSLPDEIVISVVLAIWARGFEIHGLLRPALRGFGKVIAYTIYIRIHSRDFSLHTLLIWS